MLFVYKICSCHTFSATAASCWMFDNSTFCKHSEITFLRFRTITFYIFFFLREVHPLMSNAVCVMGCPKESGPIQFSSTFYTMYIFCKQTNIIYYKLLTKFVCIVLIQTDFRKETCWIMIMNLFQKLDFKIKLCMTIKNDSQHLGKTSSFTTFFFGIKAA